MYCPEAAPLRMNGPPSGAFEAEKMGQCLHDKLHVVSLRLNRLRLRQKRERHQTGLQHNEAVKFELCFITTLELNRVRHTTSPAAHA